MGGSSVLVNTSFERACWHKEISICFLGVYEVIDAIVSLVHLLR